MIFICKTFFYCVKFFLEIISYAPQRIKTCYEGLLPFFYRLCNEFSCRVGRAKKIAPVLDQSLTIMKMTNCSEILIIRPRIQSIIYAGEK